MKKYFVLGCTVVAALLITSCKSKESAYKRAYERAQQTQQVEVEAPVVSENAVVPVVETPQPVEVVPVTPVQATDPATVAVRTESVTLVNGQGLKPFNVVCGSFSVQANAEGLQRVLLSAGYPAQVVLNPNTNMYRVIATTHDDKPSAVVSRDALRNKYPDAWLLLNQ